jgi:enterochelin esterase family protein
LRYWVSARSDLRAVAGLSAGAKQAANISNIYSNFGTIGLFSPVLNHRQLPNNSHVRIWIGAGNGDLFHYNVTRYRKKLQRKHITHTLCPSIGGHTWINWRYYFTEFVQTIFLKH